MSYAEGQPGYQSHSRTSREAAEMLQSVNTMEGQILDRLGITAIGWTADELQQHLETIWPGVQAGTVGARLRGLELKGKVVKANRTRPTRTGRQAHEWYLKETADQLGIELAPSPESGCPEALRQQVRDLQAANRALLTRATNAELRLGAAQDTIAALEAKLARMVVQ